MYLVIAIMTVGPAVRAIEPGTHKEHLQWMQKGACDIRRISVHSGGFMPCLRLAAACEKIGMRLDLHSVGPDAYPHLQLIGATTERLIKYLEGSSLSRKPRVRPGRLTADPALNADGKCSDPADAGMGVEPGRGRIYADRVG